MDHSGRHSFQKEFSKNGRCLLGAFMTTCSRESHTPAHEFNKLSKKDDTIRSLKRLERFEMNEKLHQVLTHMLYGYCRHEILFQKLSIGRR